jgi:hypothetical protein
MQFNKIYSFKINPDDFDLDRMLLNLKAIEEGPIKIRQLIKELK